MGLGTLINGKTFDSSSVEIQIVPTGNAGAAAGIIGAAVGAIAGGSLFNCTEINYSDSLTPGVLRVIGSPLKQGRTRGEYDAKCDFTMPMADARAMLDVLGGFGGFGEVEFQITVTYAEAGSPPICDVIEGIRITDPSVGQSQSADPSVMKFDCDAMRIKWNGKYLVQPGGVAGVIGSLIP